MTNDLIARRFVLDADDMDAILQTSKVEKYNPNHDARGRFTSGGGGGMVSETKITESYKDLKLTKEEDMAVGTYLGAGHVVNTHIRNGNLDATTDYAKVEDTMKGLDSAIERAPSLPEGNLYRVTSAPAVEDLWPGVVISDKGYSSTTTADLLAPENGQLLLTLSTVSGGRKALMVISNNEGKKGLSMKSLRPKSPIAEFEREVILPRDTKLKFVGIDAHLYGSGSIPIFKFERQ